VLGRNGSGKTLLGMALLDAAAAAATKSSKNPYLLDGTIRSANDEEDDKDGTVAQRRTKRLSAQHVSFQSHQELLERDSAGTMTTFKAVTDGAGNLSRSAQFLVVRFGLFPLLHRRVRTLSTGEIRKVLLVRALSKNPALLVLDNAFDGLDVPSREILKDIASKTLQGFKQDILVQAVDVKSTVRTQIVMMTQRPDEELVDEIQYVSAICCGYYNRGSDGNNAWYGNGNEKNNKNASFLATYDRTNRTFLSSSPLPPSIRSLDDYEGDDKLLLQLATKQQQDRNNTATSSPSLKSTLRTMFWDDDSTLLPSHETVRDWWTFRKTSRDNDGGGGGGEAVLVEAKNLSIRVRAEKDDDGDDNDGENGEGEDYVELLRNLNWTVRRGERWLVAGGNGAGKSTLSRWLAFDTETETDPNDKSTGEYRQKQQQKSGVGWVSTELHMRMAKSTKTARQIIANGADESIDASVPPVAAWLQLDDDSLLDRPFVNLSQGQQKLVLIAAAINERPSLLVVDEPNQGLDIWNRQRVLGLIQRVCECTDISLVYITHHFEELLPCITHVLHLQDKQDAYQGTIQDYNPAKIAAQQ